MPRDYTIPGTTHYYTSLLQYHYLFSSNQGHTKMTTTIAAGVDAPRADIKNYNNNNGQ